MSLVSNTIWKVGFDFDLCTTLYQIFTHLSFVYFVSCISSIFVIKYTKSFMTALLKLSQEMSHASHVICHAWSESSTHQRCIMLCNIVSALLASWYPDHHHLNFPVIFYNLAWVNIEPIAEVEILQEERKMFIIFFHWHGFYLLHTYLILQFRCPLFTDIYSTSQDKYHHCTLPWFFSLQCTGLCRKSAAGSFDLIR